MQCADQPALSHDYMLQGLHAAERSVLAAASRLTSGDAATARVLSQGCLSVCRSSHDAVFRGPDVSWAAGGVTRSRALQRGPERKGCRAGSHGAAAGCCGGVGGDQTQSPACSFSGRYTSERYWKPKELRAWSIGGIGQEGVGVGGGREGCHSQTGTAAACQTQTRLQCVGCQSAAASCPPSFLSPPFTACPPLLTFLCLAICTYLSQLLAVLSVASTQSHQHAADHQRCVASPPPPPPLRPSPWRAIKTAGAHLDLCLFFGGHHNLQLLHKLGVGLDEVLLQQLLPRLHILQTRNFVSHVMILTHTPSLIHPQWAPGNRSPALQ